MKKVALHNLGCKVNAYETESMRKLLSEAGYEIVDFENDVADVYIINTCSVTNIADRKSRQMLHRAKKMNPNSVVVAAGCYVQAAGEALLEDLAVDIIVGNNKKINIVEALKNYESSHNQNQELLEIGKTKEYEPLSIARDCEHTRAFIKVQDGCNQFCTYCIIPYTRGRIRSREMMDVLSEVETLAKNGYREVVLTGIHLSSYGVDKTGECCLLELVEKVCRVEGIRRVRLGSLEPRIITEEFARRLSMQKKVCPHFHLSLQSGCDTVLKRMNRRYTTEEYRQGCLILRRYFDNPAITTDVIVGFPGETKEEFWDTRLFLEEIGFYELHVFKYSRRKGTAADRMTGQLSEKEKAKRSEQLLWLNQKMSGEYRDGLIGREVVVLFERAVSIMGVKYYLGHTAEYVEVAVEAEDDLVNSMERVWIKGRITEEILKGTCVIS